MTQTKELSLTMTYRENYGLGNHDFLQSWGKALEEQQVQQEKDMFEFDKIVLHDFIAVMNAPETGNRGYRRSLKDKRNRYWMRFMYWVKSGKPYPVRVEIPHHS